MPKKPDHAARLHSELPPSSADKWLYCPAWRGMRLAYVAKNGEPPSSADAEEGTEAHEHLEMHMKGTKPLDINYSGFHDLMPMIEWAEEQPGKLYVEQRVDFGAMFGYVGLTGTNDLGWVEPRRHTIADLKFGRLVVDHVMNPQMMCYLTGFVLRFGPRPEYRMVILQPRAFHKEGPIREFTITEEEFDHWLDNTLEPALQAAYSPRARPAAGPHCRKFCPMSGNCSAQRELGLRRMKMTKVERKKK